ncbi:hypothetical protein DASC09_037310 [Saccharomycopsis crataegensis]|uniref:Uncharacterized protein n=1 Tax=Saccharomycopsis crataegensis TaxID=43959 RepID=A0AAV5QPB4_9ASCO|nr:hypothetical protein DASC09_037310 [Saccharomycopsis crataegensis]
MGSAASKSSSARNLAKTASTTNHLKRSKIDPLGQVHKPPQNAPPTTNLHRRANDSIRPPTNNNNGPSNHREAPDTSTKDGMDPDYNAKAMSLGTVKLTEEKIKLDKNNLAIRTLNIRKQLHKIGQDSKLQTENKTLLDPRTISAILGDLDTGATREKVTKTYRLHPDFLDQLRVGVIRLAKTRSSGPRTINDYDFQQNNKHGRRKEPNQLQKQLDQLLS